LLGKIARRAERPARVTNISTLWCVSAVLILVKGACVKKAFATEKKH